MQNGQMHVRVHLVKSDIEKQWMKNPRGKATTNHDKNLPNPGFYWA